MNEYQIYTLDSGGLDLGSKTFQAETDKAAKALCELYLSNGGSAEIWRGDHRIDLVWVDQNSVYKQ